MQFSTIASGSSGNCLYAGNDETHLLIDAGISKKRIEEGLKSFDIDPKDIDAILVTHEHADHIQGLGVWSRKYHVPIYSTRGTLLQVAGCKSLGALDTELFKVIHPGEDFTVGNLSVHPFSMPHDAADPVSYRISDGKKSIGCVTDLGYASQSVMDALQGLDLLYAEANHDLRMLETGPYPYDLKRRIAGNYGHLCNEASGQMIGKLLNDHLDHIILGHLSKENNFPELALAAVMNELKRDYDLRKETTVDVAPRCSAMPVFTL